MERAGSHFVLPPARGEFVEDIFANRFRREGRPIPVAYGNIGAIVAVADFTAVSLLAALCRVLYNLIAYKTLSGLEDFVFVGAGSAVFYILINQLRGFYRPDKLLRGGGLVFDCISSWSLAAISLLTVAFVAKASTELSRGASLLLFGVGLAGIPTYRIYVRRLLIHALKNNLLSGRENIVLIGSVRQLQGQDVHDNLWRHGYCVIEQVGVRLRDGDWLHNAKAIVGATTHLKEIVRNNRIDEIFLALDIGDRRTMDLVIDQIRDIPIPVRLLFDQSTSALVASEITDLGAARSVKLRGGPLTKTQQRIKRAFDIVLSFGGLFALAPLLVLVAIAIRLDSPGPILFRQRRAGFSGRVFRIYKFRTMTTLDDGDSVRQAQKDDQRVTRIGRVLRSTSIDELPQLLNVLYGEMSLVGPRPHAISHDNEYSRLIDVYALRHHMKPGLSGWAQVNGYRGETKSIDLMEARIRHDLWYVGNWSLLLDIKIIGMTIVQLISPKGVY